jgi:N6-adenosine-specific RNA methylase IME4
MTTALVHYDAACRALAEARTVDEVMHVHDEAERLRLYGRQAKNREMMADATEIMLRAERRLGQLLLLAKEAGQIDMGGRRVADPDFVPVKLKLDDIGVDRKLSASSQRIAALPQASFDASVADMRERILARGARVLNPASTAEKQERRIQREAETATKIKALPTEKFGVIYADPEWRFEPWSRSTGMDRAPENHYATSSVEEIAARPVGSIAADDCVLFLWSTVPMLPAGLYVMERWGFTYQTNLVWCKEKIGTGYWFRNRHELLLVGTKGSPVAPAMGTQWDSVARPCDPEHHSQKPTLFRKIIESYYPTTPKIELNAADEEEWPGWTRWGAPHREAAE